MANILRKIFSVESMVKKETLHGEIPTTKSAYKNLLTIAIPSIIEMVFVSLIGSMDVIMVGRLGFAAIAAVGLAGQVRMVVMSIFLALNIGVTAIVARRKGQGLPDEANRTLRNALVIITGLSLLVAAITFIFSRNLLGIVGAQSDTIDIATEYFRIMIYFFPINALTMCINAAQRGIGDTRIAMVANVAANVVNVIFDFLLIYGNFGFPKMGVAGDAWASGIGFCVGLLISIFGLVSKKRGDRFLHISFKDNWRLHWPTIKSLFVLGGNSVIEQVAQRVGIFIYAASIANLGTAVFAAHQVGMELLSFSFHFGNGLATASTSLVGQTLGEGRPDLSVIYGKCSQRLAMILSVLIASSVILLRVPLVGIFLSRSDPANLTAFTLAVDLMFMVALFQLPQTSSVVVCGCLRGAGDNLYVAVVFVICVGVLRPVLCLMAVNVFHLGLLGAWGASFIDICLRFTLAYRRFSGSKWQSIKV